MAKANGSKSRRVLQSRCGNTPERSEFRGYQILVTLTNTMLLRCGFPESQGGSINSLKQRKQAANCISEQSLGYCRPNSNLLFSIPRNFRIRPDQRGPVTRSLLVGSGSFNRRSETTTGVSWDGIEDCGGERNWGQARQARPDSRWSFLWLVSSRVLCR